MQIPPDFVSNTIAAAGDSSIDRETRVGTSRYCAGAAMDQADSVRPNSQLPFTVDGQVLGPSFHER
jgi:hypothetical protein